MEKDLIDRLPLLANDTAYEEFKLKTAQLRQKIADEEEPGDSIRLELLEATLAKYEEFKAVQVEPKNAS